MFHNIQFADPSVLRWLWLIVPMSMAGVSLAAWRAGRGQFDYTDDSLMQRPNTKLSVALTGAMAVSSVVLFIVAYAYPLRPAVPDKVKMGSTQLIAVTDVSWSMAAEDYRPMMPPKDGVPAMEVIGPYGSRLDMAKQLIFTQLMPAMAGNRLGIVAYCGDSLEQAPLTDDFNAEGWVVRHFMKVGYAPKDGTNYIAGFNKAIAMFKAAKQPAPQRVIVWMSDGGMTASTDGLDDVIKTMHELHIKLFVVAMGVGHGAVIPLYSSSGQKSGLFDQGNTVADVELDNLKQVATLMQTSVLRYQPGEPPAGLTIAHALAADASEQTDGEPLYRYPLGAAMALVFALVMRGAFRRRSAALQQL